MFAAFSFPGRLSNAWIFGFNVGRMELCHGFKRNELYARSASYCLPTSSAAVRENSEVALKDDDTKYLETRRKKKVAMWLGYAGTNYRGLQCQPEDLVEPVTVEGELIRAVYKSGGILESNSRDLSKISWSRSSRTDKGVHSIATVVSFNMEVERTSWMSEKDAEGASLASQVNAHLPADIRVFSVIPAARSFSGRRFCKNRTYHYFVPAALLGLHPLSTAPEVQEQVDRFQGILSHFEGRHPFHNYTVRRLYRSSTLAKFKSQDPVKDTRSAEREAMDEEVTDDSSVSHSDSDGSDSKASGSFEKRQTAWWLSEPPKLDKIGASHFRKIFSCTCGSMEILGGVPVVRVMMKGESFMLHQIRKMVGTALCVFMQKLPLDVMKASLCRHARVVLPLGPPDGLLLHSCEFYPFRGSASSGFSLGDSGLPAQTQRVVQLSSATAEQTEAFFEAEIGPHVALRMDHTREPWCDWLSSLEDLVPEEEATLLVDRWKEWLETKQAEDVDAEDSTLP